jgi:hypothetical protein
MLRLLSMPNRDIQHAFLSGRELCVQNHLKAARTLAHSTAQHACGAQDTAAVEAAAQWHSADHFLDALGGKVFPRISRVRHCMPAPQLLMPNARVLLQALRCMSQHTNHRHSCRSTCAVVVICQTNTSGAQNHAPCCGRITAGELSVVLPQPWQQLAVSAIHFIASIHCNEMDWFDIKWNPHCIRADAGGVQWSVW